MSNTTFANEQYQLITQCVRQVVKNRYKFVYKIDGDISDSYMSCMMNEMLSIEEQGGHLEGSPTTIIILDRDYAVRLTLARILYPLYEPVE